METTEKKDRIQILKELQKNAKIFIDGASEQTDDSIVMFATTTINEKREFAGGLYGNPFDLATLLMFCFAESKDFFDACKMAVETFHSTEIQDILKEEGLA